MLRGIYASAFGMIQNQVDQDTTANNIANSTTVGFKQDQIIAVPFRDVMLQNKSNERFGKPAVQKLGAMPLGVLSDGPYTDFTQGPVITTDNNLDFAINGRGFFPVEYFDGENQSVLYTRCGSFQLDAQGNVVSSDGSKLLARDANTGQIVPVNVGNGKVTVDSEGNVYVDSVKKYTLSIVDFNDYNDIHKFGKNMYEINNGSNANPVELGTNSYSIEQGKLEQSNVDMELELVNMITNLRRYQANQRVLQSIDETLSKTVNEVGSLK
ncbi:MAG: flagellar hook-basal body complex protein [Clostridiales bacterium]|nr:flagellar hook-basal body complex protein [Clostridiales bacterium]HBM81483.1 flagellar basal body rod protein FlgG [Clostridiaceae bacterium]